MRRTAGSDGESYAASNTRSGRRHFRTPDGCGQAPQPSAGHFRPAASCRVRGRWGIASFGPPSIDRLAPGGRAVRERSLSHAVLQPDPRVVVDGPLSPSARRHPEPSRQPSGTGRHTAPRPSKLFAMPGTRCASSASGTSAKRLARGSTLAIPSYAIETTSGRSPHDCPNLPTAPSAGSAAPSFQPKPYWMQTLDTTETVLPTPWIGRTDVPCGRH